MSKIKDLLEKSEMVVNATMMGQEPVEMSAQFEAMANLPAFYNSLKTILSNMPEYGLVDVMIDLQDGHPYCAEFSRKGPNVFTCVLRHGGDLMQEIKDQTVEIIASMIATQIGSQDAILDEFHTESYDSPEEVESAVVEKMDPIMEPVEMAIEASQELTSGPVINNPKKFSVEIHDNQIAIYIEKSQGKNMAENNFDKNKKKPQDGQEQKKPAPQQGNGQKQMPPQAKPQQAPGQQKPAMPMQAKPQMNGQQAPQQMQQQAPMQSNGQNDQMVNKTQMQPFQSNEASQDQDLNSSTAHEFPNPETMNDPQAQMMQGEEDDNNGEAGQIIDPQTGLPSTEPDVDIAGMGVSGDGDQNTETEEGMGQQINGQDLDEDGNPINSTDMSQDGEMNGQEPTNMVFVKTTIFDGGVQHWYRDQKTGKVVEGAEPPPGSDSMNQAMQAVMNKLTELSNQVQSMGAPGQAEMQADPMMQPGASAPGQDQLMEDQDAMMDDGSGMPGEEGMEGAPLDLSEEGAEGEMGEDPNGDVSEAEFDQMVSEELGPEMADGPSANDQAKAEIAQGGKEQGGAPAAAPAAKENPMAKKKEQVKKALIQVKATLEAKYPNLKGEDMKKALLQAAVAISERLEKAVTVAKVEDIAQEEVQEHEKKDHSPEHHAVEHKEMKKKGLMKKSRLARMWNVFGIEMPESLDSKDNVEKAQSGIARLQKSILKQGKSEEEANRIVNRAVIEKYDLMTKGKANFKNRDEFMGVVTVADGKAKTDEVLKSDSDRRFNVREYMPESGSMVTSRNGEELAKSVNKLIEGQTADFGSEYKNFEEKIFKANPTREMASAKENSDRMWNVPEFKGEARPLSVEKTSTVHEQVKKSLEAPKDVSFDKYKTFNEEEVKKSRTEKTDQEIQDELANKRWEALNGSSK